jgi:hypothetical protein
VNPQVVDRVNNVQSLLCSAAGIRRVTIHPTKCPLLVKALEGLTWKEGTNTIDKTLGLDHITDAFGYPLFQKWNVLYNVLPRTTPSGSTLQSPFGSEAA